ncbi:cyclopropane-fatty-acyl-phospholipid synthase family protein [Hyphomicrobium sp. 99]|uniref:SAM-dependent methyltransferase n=1 Tax=Hyphomicrobium sp. 99 TaxID=1163419 RepID=UPI0005F7EAB9|nr:cyclopropane-fatty-acyl-phospholipid synthase family protein [Hyphomicrobium sp. 99]
MNDTTVNLRLGDCFPTRSPLARLIARRIPPIDAGGLHLSLPDGGVIRRRGDAPGPEAIIEVSSWRALVRTLFDGEHGFADAYLAGEWSTPDLKAVLAWAMVNEQVLARAAAGSWLTRLQNRFRHLRRENTRSGSRRNIAAHYDLGNSFYQAWLDAGMNYSSAIYTGEETLEDAQNRKLDRVIELLGLEGGERVLEIGCGWGSLAARIVSNGCHLTGLTLSREQLAYAQGQITRAESGAADLRLQDYRDVEGRYDRVASIEMIEAVGERFWPAYFSKLRSVLKEGGIAVLQAITIDEKRFANYRKNPDFIQRYIFPGGMLPTSTLIAELASAAGLTLVHDEAFGMSYARTLAEWRSRFLCAWPRIESMGFDQRFRRMWEYYLTYCEVGFLSGTVDVKLFKFVR